MDLDCGTAGAASTGCGSGRTRARGYMEGPALTTSSISSTSTAQSSSSRSPRPPDTPKAVVDRASSMRRVGRLRAADLSAAVRTSRIRWTSRPSSTPRMPPVAADGRVGQPALGQLLDGGEQLVGLDVDDPGRRLVGDDRADGGGPPAVLRDGGERLGGEQADGHASLDGECGQPALVDGRERRSPRNSASGWTCPRDGVRGELGGDPRAERARWTRRARAARR